MNNQKNQLKHVTVTIIFDGAALNRDEKIGGSIQSVKKLNVNGKLRTFISKVSFRHYFFETLQKAYNWKAAPVALRGDRTNQTIQFDLSNADILSHSELDAFGYMYTISGQAALTRKSPIGITKAISLFPYEQDMAFYANHDLVNRGRNQGITLNPNPYSKEENNSLYKISFTLDMDVFGKDSWIINDNPIIEDDCLQITIDEGVNKSINISSHKDDVYTIRENSIIHTIKKESLNDDGPYKITFEIDRNEKVNRIKQILNVIKNGLHYQSSGEANTIVPLFIIASGVKVPSPIFHSHVDIKDGNVIGVDDSLNNGWIDGDVYIQDCERLSADLPDQDKITQDWQDFLKSIGVENNNRESE